MPVRDQLAERGHGAPQLRVDEHDRGRTLVLRGRMPLGLFSGTRRYRLQPVGEARTDFTMEESYGGPLAGLVTRSIPDLQPSFEAFTAGLRRAAEAGATGSARPPSDGTTP